MLFNESRQKIRSVTYYVILGVIYLLEHITLTVMDILFSVSCSVSCTVGGLFSIDYNDVQVRH